MSNPTPLTIFDLLRDVLNSTNDAVKVAPTGGGVPAGSTTLPAYDYLAVTYPTAVKEVYTFKTGGVGGTTVLTITIDYVDSTKASLLDVAWT